MVHYFVRCRHIPLGIYNEIVLKKAVKSISVVINCFILNYSLFPVEGSAERNCNNKTAGNPLAHRVTKKSLKKMFTFIIWYDIIAKKLNIIKEGT